MKSPETTVATACALLFASMVLFVNAQPARAQDDIWTSGGPYGGAITALVSDSESPGTLYAAAACHGIFAGNGVYKTIDGGDTWHAVSKGLTDTCVSALAIDSQTPTTLYAGTRGGVFKSVDGGTTWQA